MNSIIRFANLTVAALMLLLGMVFPHLAGWGNPFHLQAYTLIALAIVCVLNYVALLQRSRTLAGVAFVLNLLACTVEPTYSGVRTAYGAFDWFCLIFPLVNCVFLWRAYPVVMKPVERRQER